MKVVRPAGGRALLGTQSPDNARIDLIKKSSGQGGNLTMYIRELQLFKEKSKRERERPKKRDRNIKKEEEGGKVGLRTCKIAATHSCVCIIIIMESSEPPKKFRRRRKHVFLFCFSALRVTRINRMQLIIRHLRRLSKP